MTEGQPTTPPPTASDATSSSDDDADLQTVEEVKAHWASRFSKRDTAHNAEVNALRGERDALKAQLDAIVKAQAESGASGQSEADRYKAAAEEAQRLLDEERKRFAVETRKVKYPVAAEALGDDALLVFDEGRLAAINVRLSDGEPARVPIVDPNSPPRTPSGPAREPTAEDLKAELRRMAPEFLADIQSTR